MGGRNALNFSYRFPNYVEKLVIVDIGPESDPAGEKSIRDLINLVPVPFISKESAREFFQNNFSKLYKGPENPRTLGLFLYSNLEDSNGKLDWKFYLPGILESVKLGRVSDRWSEVKALTMPTLIVRGEKSKDLSSKIFSQMIECNHNIQGKEVPGAGHWVHADKPNEVVQVLRDFLNN